MKKITILTVLFLIFGSFSAKAQDFVSDQFLVHLGVSGYFPRTDYVSNMAGFNCGFEYISKKDNVYMFDMSISGGRAKKDFHTGEGWIFRRDYVDVPQLFINYGHVVKHINKFQMFPFVGMGISGFELGHDSDDDDYPSKDGFSIGAGLGLDWDFCRGRRSWSEDWNHGLLIKPFMSVTFMNTPVKIVPSFNIAVCYCFGSKWDD